MTSALVVPTWAAIVVVAVVVLLVAVVVRLTAVVHRARSESRAVLASAARDAEALRGQLVELEEQLREQASLVEQAALERTGSPLPEVTFVDDREYVITDLERRRGRTAVPTVPTPVFVDIVLRESLIRTASLAAGVRRALAPEVRHRVRFEMKREVKRSRKQRRLRLRQARRDLATRQRAEL